jgi:hypothetical protein
MAALWNRQISARQSKPFAKKKIASLRYTHKAPAIRVNYSPGSVDFLCVLLALVGQSTEYIASRTGLSVHQVTYRLFKYEQQRPRGELTGRKAFRNGQSALAQSVIASATANRSNIRRAIVERLGERSLLENRIIPADKRLGAA